MEHWRLIIDPPLTGAENMAVDEAMLRITGVPTLRLYGWSAPTLSIGYLQDASPYLGAGIPVVRRITGGRALLHDAELTYSVVARANHPLFSGGVGPTYTAIAGPIVEALNAFRIDASMSRTAPGNAYKRNGACFKTPGRFEVAAGGRKIAGCAQRRFKNAFLQHGSILFDVDKNLNEALFGPGILSHMTWVKAFGDISVEDFREVFVEKFSRSLGVTFRRGTLADTEARLAERLLSLKYSTGQWNAAGTEGVSFLQDTGATGQGHQGNHGWDAKNKY